MLPEGPSTTPSFRPTWLTSTAPNSVSLTRSSGASTAKPWLCAVILDLAGCCRSCTGWFTPAVAVTQLVGPEAERATEQLVCRSRSRTPAPDRVSSSRTVATAVNPQRPGHLDRWTGTPRRHPVPSDVRRVLDVDGMTMVRMPRWAIRCGGHRLDAVVQRRDGVNRCSPIASTVYGCDVVTSADRSAPVIEGLSPRPGSRRASDVAGTRSR